MKQVALGFLCLVLSTAALATGREERRGLEKHDEPEATLVLPFYQVDTVDPTGTTTLFAVRNVEPTAVDLVVTFFSTGGSELRSDVLSLPPQATRTVNVRDVAGLPPDLDGVARGFVIVDAFGGDISGDFFQVDIGENFATGERMISSGLCPEHEIRFADFGNGTELVLLFTTPRGADPDVDLPSAVVTPVDEAGTAFPATEIYTEEHLLFLRASDFTTEAFGTLIFDFMPAASGGGWVYAVYSAGGKFSVGLGSSGTSARTRRCSVLVPAASQSAAAQPDRKPVLKPAPLAGDSSSTASPETVSPETVSPETVSPETVSSETKDSVPEDRWVLPFYQVDTTDSGTTTLFAIRNAGTEAAQVEVRYHEVDATPIRSDTLELAAGATRTVNLRDVAGLPVDTDGFARGFATLQGDVSAQLVGDFFQVDVGQNFATGERLISPRLDFCGGQEIRFADFGSGTELMLVLTDPRGTEPLLDPPSVIVTPYDEAGVELPPTEIYTDRHVIFVDAADFTSESFGTLRFQFDSVSSDDGGWVYGVYSADGRFSVGLNSTARRNGRGCRQQDDFPQ